MCVCSCCVFVSVSVCCIYIFVCAALVSVCGLNFYVYVRFTSVYMLYIYD